MTASTHPATVPACCSRCTHLISMHSAAGVRNACLRRLDLAPACGWWAPRSRSATAPTPTE